MVDREGNDTGVVVGTLAGNALSLAAARGAIEVFEDALRELFAA